MPLVFEVPTAGDVLGMMITPAVLISASGTLTLSTTNRLSRVVDRIRYHVTELERLGPDSKLTPRELDERRALVTSSLHRLGQRMGYLQNALTLLYGAIVLLVGTSLSVGLKAATNWLPEWVPIGTGLGGATALLGASVLLVRETRLAVHSSLEEMTYAQTLVSRKLGPPPG
jgi:hypothetical protein